MKKPIGNFLKDEIAEKNKEAIKKLRLIKLLGVVSVSLCIAAIANPKQPKQDLIGQLGFSSVFSFLAAYVCKENEDLFKQYNTFVEMNREHKKNEISLRFGKAMMLNTAANEIDLASKLETLPPAAQARYIQKFDLHGLLLPQLQEIVSDSGGNSPGITDHRFSSIDSDLRELEKETEIDLSWIDSDFINSSKVVVGGRGSGKSVYLRYEAARWLLEHPSGYLLIIDPHYDYRIESKWWLNDIPQKQVMKRFLSKNKETRNPGEHNEWKGYLYHLRNVWVELQSRINADDDSEEAPNYRPIKIIVDEIENIKRGCAETEFKEILKLIDCIQDEGRKYLVEITIGMHGLKKENTGIDSNTIAQMNWLLFEKACYDPVTKYPSDFNANEIKAIAKQISNSLDPKIGRTVVILKQELSSPIITVLPLLKPPIIDVGDKKPIEPESVASDSGGENVDDHLSHDDPPESKDNDAAIAYKAMLDWCKRCQETYQRIPSAEHIKQAWEELTGQLLSENALIYLIEKLMADMNK
ncbi:hypothetical protein [Nostoc phage N1]|nr:hypothetical protein [Nostoc phage N1]